MTGDRVPSLARERFNDSIRWLIARWIVVSAVGFHLITLVRVRVYRLNQRRLGRKYGIRVTTPVRIYDRGTRDAVEDRFSRLGPTAVFVETSGTTNEPKKIAYDRRRFRQLRRIFIEALFCQLAGIPGHRNLFIFASMGRDSTLTGRLLAEDGIPPYVCGLQAPHRVGNHAAIRGLAEAYGETAVRLWILALADPDVFYATNPSTLARFFEDVRGDWMSSRRLVADYVADPGGLPAVLGRIHRSIASRGAQDRLRTIAQSPAPLSPGRMFPSLRAFCCWDGGYVGTFIDQIREHLPSANYRHLPMYSMATETVLALRDGLGHFLPMAPGVFYEFLEESMTDQPENILLPEQLRPGRRYTMVVSDNYGLRRYQTDDLFECVGMVSGVPDLRFARRRTLSYSFTGEKLTGEQLKLAYQYAIARFPEMSARVFLTCFPSKPDDERLPRYRLVFVQTENSVDAPHGAITRCVERRLTELNQELRSKIESRRLGTFTFETLDIPALVAKVRDRGLGRDGWESQFKFLPLYPKLWEASEAS